MAKFIVPLQPRSEKDKSAIRVFLKAYPDRPLHQIDPYEIFDDFLFMRGNTYNRYLNIIAAALNLAFKRKWCEKIQLVKRDKEVVNLRFFSREEWNKIQKALPAHLLPIANFAISTRLRKSNVLNLRWADIDLKKERLRIDATGSKSGRHNGIKLNKAAIEALKSQIGKNSEFVFTYNGSPISDIKTAWKSALIKAEVEHLRWHALRTTWASWHVMQGTTLAELKELGGWASLDMVLVYAHLAPNHLDKCVENVSKYGL